ncbi:EAL domain-containing protein [Cohnella hashimotonis]|uniref:EAL domain-containing protein n=1 Tax=Cohnella hashimotonis TaxID=2826895 RepID=A0ABT6TGZ0_9BACL|nr:EAL domain-containing protein [Cohnella hashimotonis]MDI4646113.1 EAL domain-containing protein [Cohnella hashimotonis]
MSCRQCMAGEPLYEIRLADPANEAVAGEIVRFLAERGAPKQSKSDAILMRENAVADFYDFCLDHMNPASMAYRVNEGEWRPFTSLPEELREQWVEGVIAEERVVPYAQPIMSADGDIFGYEVLARFRAEDGKLLSPAEVFGAAKRRNRLYALDRMCRMAAVRSAVHLQGKVFINFIPTSIYSPQHCLRSTTALTRELGLDASKFVFEVVESEQVEDLAHLKSILSYYTEQGFSYALDDVGAGFNTPELLREIRPHYMKLDRGAADGVSEDPIKQRMAGELLRTALQVGAVPLAEGIEREEDYRWLLSLGYQLFQGYLWGRPEPIVPASSQ